jgi:hypothetical protein
VADRPTGFYNIQAMKVLSLTQPFVLLSHDLTTRHVIKGASDDAKFF